MTGFFQRDCIHCGLPIVDVKKASYIGSGNLRLVMHDACVAEVQLRNMTKAGVTPDQQACVQELVGLGIDQTTAFACALAGIDASMLKKGE